MAINAYGFEEVGHWELDERRKNGISFKLHNLGDKRVVYAFVIGDDVKYIGVCEVTSTTLNDRMKSECNNTRIAKEIKKSREHGEVVRIFALKPESVYRYKDLDVDLVKGLENPLIKKLKAEWNIHQ